MIEFLTIKPNNAAVLLQLAACTSAYKSKSSL